MKTFIISLIFLAVASCNTKITKEVSSAANEEIIEQKEQTAELINEVETKILEELPDCLSEYSTVDDVLGKEGKIVNVTDKLMIAFGTSSRLNPCNLPDGYIQGQNVKFSGKVKKAPQGVRLSGTPFVLTIIEKM